MQQASLLNVVAAGPGLEPGACFADRFVICRWLRRDSAGSLYEATDSQEGAVEGEQGRCLLRVFPAAWAGQDAEQALACADTARQRQLDGEHIVRALTAGVDSQSAQLYLASEWYEGESLEDLLRQRDFIPPGEALAILEDLCAGLGAAHAAGLWHGALKPANVVLTSSQDGAIGHLAAEAACHDAQPTWIGRPTGMLPCVKLVGLGVHQLLRAMQCTGDQVLYSPQWMAPEQASPGKPCGAAADIWTLGLLAFRMLTGHSYWRAARHRPLRLMGLMREIMLEPLAPASVRARELGCEDRLPEGFDPWFARCVVRAPAARFMDAEQARTALNGLIEKNGVASPGSDAANPEAKLTASASDGAALRKLRLPLSRMVLRRHKKALRYAVALIVCAVMLKSSYRTMSPSSHLRPSSALSLSTARAPAQAAKETPPAASRSDGNKQLQPARPNKEPPASAVPPLGARPGRPQHERPSPPVHRPAWPRAHEPAPPHLHGPGRGTQSHSPDPDIREI